jgi:integration host factor subunit alpha
MNEMNSSDFEALLTAQRSAMIRDIPTSPANASAETPTLTKAELAELLFDNVGLNKREAKDMVEAFFEVIRDALESGDSATSPSVPAGILRPARLFRLLLAAL